MPSFFTIKDGAWPGVDSDIDKSGTSYYPEVIRVIDTGKSFIAHGYSGISAYTFLAGNSNFQEALDEAIIKFNSIQP